jgi:probable glucitol transport protein GutA
MGSKKREKNPNKLGLGRQLAWNSRTISSGISAVLMSFVTIYCTNAIGLNPVLVGTIMMASKLLDGVTDLFAGYLVDRTNTKLGRGRPYELALVGMWVCNWALFSVPKDFPLVAQCAWIFVFYTLSQSVFTTLLNANGTPYMIRAFNNEKHYIALSSIGGIIVTAGVIVFNVIFPMFEAKVLYDAAGWSRLIFTIAIPLTVLGLLRFFLIPEKYESTEKETEPLKFKDVITVLKTNKYVYLIMLIMLVSQICAGMGVTNYYFIYIVGDLTLAGVMGLIGIIPMLSLALYPLILKKTSTAKLIQFGLLFQVPAAILAFAAKDNLGMLAISGILGGLSSLPMSYMGGLLVIDCANYNEWKGIRRMEATMSSMTGFASKIGQALGSYLMGFFLNISHFDGTLTMQPDSAQMMLRLLNSFIPMAIMMAVFFAMFAWKLDKMKPQIESDLATRREQTME